jgi:hypothetical protein
MNTTMSQNMGKVTTTLIVTNWVDEVLAERGFIQSHEIRSITLENVLVDTGASRLCLPQEIIQALGLKCIGENDVKTALGITKVRERRSIRLHRTSRRNRPPTRIDSLRRPGLRTRPAKSTTEGFAYRRQRNLPHGALDRQAQ